MKYFTKQGVVTLAGALLVGLSLTVMSTAKAANEWTSAEDNEQYITVYQHCDFRGGSKRLSKGKYSRVQDEDIPNDEISSIRIPDGMFAKVYKHTKFKGDSRELHGDVRCLQGDLNDEISSIKVYKGKAWVDSDDGWGAAGGNHCVSYSVSATGGQGGFRLTHDPRNFQRIDGRAVSGQICNRDNVQVELSKTDRQTGVFLNVGGKRYRFNQGDAGDKFENYWYRKYYTIRLK